MLGSSKGCEGSGNATVVESATCVMRRVKVLQVYLNYGYPTSTLVPVYQQRSLPLGYL